MCARASRTPRRARQKKRASLGRTKGRLAVLADFVAVLASAGAALVGPLVRALRDGDGDRAANAARIVAETIAFKRALRKVRK